MFAKSAIHMADDEVARRTGPLLRRPEEREEYRRSLHKSSSPHWKGAYRQRCRERLQASRQKFLSRFRQLAMENKEGDDPVPRTSSTDLSSTSLPSKDSIAPSVQEVMMEEWEHVRTEYGNLPEIPQAKKSKVSVSNCCPLPSVASSNQQEDDTFLSTDLDEDIELVLSIMEELTKELIEEEQALLAQYERDVHLDEEALCVAIQSLSTDEVVCPVCQRDFLHQNKHIIFCSCGVRLDMAQDGISLDYMRKQLDHFSLEHSSQCSGKPSFSLECVIDTQTLIMNCTECGFMEIIV